MRVVQHQKEAAAAGPPSGRRQRCRSLARCAAAHAAALFGAALLAAALLPRRAAALASGAGAAVHHAKASGHDCPQYGGTILDLPDTTDCRRLLSKLSSAGCLPHYHAAVVQDAPEETCCLDAASFFESQCHCWSSQFDTAAVAAVAAVDAACSNHLEAQQAQQQGAGEDGGGSEADAAAAGGIQLTRLRERGAGSTQQAQQQGQQQQAQHVGAGATGSGGGGSNIRLFVGVLSAGARREARDAIRATWAAHPAAYRLRFFLARPTDDTLFAQVRAEAIEKRDVVVLGHITEHYHNITHQTLEVMRIAAADPGVTHVLKVDDDSYVHFDRLLHRLTAVRRERLFMGYIENPGGQPHREPKHPWYVSKEEWPSERFPPWAHGAGYVLSADLAAELASGVAFAASVGGHLFKLEDIALASWLEWAAEKGGFKVHLVVDKRFNYGGCRFGDLVSHYIKPPQQRCMWEKGGECRC